LQVPSLIDRKEDIPLLSEHFLTVFCKKHNIPKVQLPEETLTWLLNYPWPGNVRELKNAIEAGIVLCKDGVLCPGDMHLGGLPEMPDESQQPSSAPFTLEENERLAIVRALKKTGGIQKDAAELLGISRRAIHYKIKKYNIDSAALRSRG
jgi:DNA-binding NtrC family response regulator